jgi:elongation factor Tu
MVMPRDNAELTIKPNKAIVREERSRLAIREGNPTVGADIVTQIME